jgi:hypothetical protein
MALCGGCAYRWQPADTQPFPTGPGSRGSVPSRRRGLFRNVADSGRTGRLANWGAPFKSFTIPLPALARAAHAPDR